MDSGAVLPPGNQAALDQLGSAHPTAFLRPSAQLSEQARSASEGLFQWIVRHGLGGSGVPGTAEGGRPEGWAPRPAQLYVEGLDPEQIWLQLDLHMAPILGRLRRRIRKSERLLGPAALLVPPPDEPLPTDGGLGSSQDLGGTPAVNEAGQDAQEGDEDGEGEEPLAEAAKRAAGRQKKRREGPGGELEDRFLSLKDMEQFLEDAEKGDLAPMPELYGSLSPDEEGDGDDDEDGEEGGGTPFGRADGAASEDEIRYDDFFAPARVGKKGAAPSRGGGAEDDAGQDGKEDGDGEGGPDGEEADEEEGEEEGARERDEREERAGRGEGAAVGGARSSPLEGDGRAPPSAHEARAVRMRRRIAELEEANLHPSKWTMKGEVTASKRPMNSALEVELDFEHAARPVPVITEEATASLEDLIRGRIQEAAFDDTQRKAAPAAAAPSRERVELDENPSQKGLAEVYEAEYMQSTGQATPASTAADGVRREAGALFKALCAKLDALSHFHFAPKPVVEDVTVRVDVPAVLMEEVAPLAVSEASLLAPEEVFAGGEGAGGVRGSASGAVKGESELTHEERRRRHRKAKRRRHAELGARGEAPPRPSVAAQAPGAAPGKRKQSEFTKSAQVFGGLQDVREQAGGSKSAGVRLQNGGKGMTKAARTSIKL